MIGGGIQANIADEEVGGGKLAGVGIGPAFAPEEGVEVFANEVFDLNRINITSDDEGGAVRGVPFLMKAAEVIAGEVGDCFGSSDRASLCQEGIWEEKIQLIVDFVSALGFKV